MQRIIFLNRYFYPDHSATSQILSDLALHWAAAGRSIQVITSQQRYGAPNADLPAHEIMRGIEIHRVRTTRFGRSGLVGRSVDYLSYYLSAWRKLTRLAQPGDILVAKTDPPLLSIIAAYVARRRGAHLVNWLQDLYPEVAIELGVPLLNGPIGWLITRLRNRSLQRARANVVLGTAMAARLIQCGVTKHHIHIIPNWTDDTAIFPVSPARNRLRHRWGLDQKFVVGYSGNLGRAHDTETILAAAEHITDRADIIFVLIGAGPQMDDLEKRVRGRGLSQMFRFLPYQDRAQLRYSLSLPDVHWLSLKNRLEGLIFPSKFYGIAAAGRPIIAIASRNGEIAKLLEQHECGIAIEPGDAAALSETLRHLADDHPRCEMMGRNARAMLELRFSRERAFQCWDALLNQLA